MSKKTQTGYYKVGNYTGEEVDWVTEEEKRFHEKMADRLIETREAAGMTQEKLAEKVGSKATQSTDMKPQSEKSTFLQL